MRTSEEVKRTIAGVVREAHHRPAFATVDAQLLCAELMLDLRDQNERIIALLEQGALSSEEMQNKMRRIAANSIAEVAMGARRGA